MVPNSVLEIDLSALSQNVQAIKKLLSPGVKLCAVVKADAYGLGAVPISRKLEQIGVNYLAVYDASQAEPLLDAGIQSNVLIFKPEMDLPDSPAALQALHRSQLHFALHSPEQLQRLRSKASWLKIRLPVHVEIDTGMSRGGLLPAEAQALIKQAMSYPEIDLAGVFTHASSADTDSNVTLQQQQIFEAALAGLPTGVTRHLANTWATLSSKQCHNSMVRVGLGLWGYPSEGNWAMAGLKPITRWSSHFVHVKIVPKGSYVGYNRTFRTNRDTRIGIVPVGYADGYPLLLSNQGVVRVSPQNIPANLIGRVNMDQIMIDITDVPEAQVGTPLELISNDPKAPNSMHTLAKLAQSHPYEMLCRISPRVMRKYVG